MSVRTPFSVCLGFLSLTFALTGCNGSIDSAKEASSASTALDPSIQAQIDPKVTAYLDAQKAGDSIRLKVAESALGVALDKDTIGGFVSGVDPATLKSLGVTIGTTAGGISTVNIPLNQLGQVITHLPHGSKVQAAQALTLQSDVSVPGTGAPKLWYNNPSYTPKSPNPPPYADTTGTSGITGKGVVVGVVDTGIDWTHDDFKNADGTTRIKYLWDQRGGFMPTPPPGFTYGSEFSAAAIDANQYVSSDGTGHGTFIAGIAAGNGRGFMPHPTPTPSSPNTPTSAWLQRPIWSSSRFRPMLTALCQTTGSWTA